MLKFRVKILILLVVSMLISSFFCTEKIADAKSLPIYNVDGCELTVRSKFFTSYYNSSNDRKWNIKLASDLLNNSFIDVGAEFSFNDVVGERTEKRGFRNAKIIVNGEFTDGVGGGVCQVSTTLYNAVLLAGLKITEYHPHTLSVSYVAPSFDAMVNSGTADFKFVNNTKNPIIINSIADGNRLTVYITGEKSKYRYERLSVKTGEIPFKIEKIIDDGSYPELFVGEEKIVSYGKVGIKSKGYLLKYLGDRLIEKRLIRVDSYKSINCVIVLGQTEREQNLLEVLE